MDTSSLLIFFRTWTECLLLTHKVGITYATPGQTHKRDILGNNHSLLVYTHFLEGLRQLIYSCSQVDV